ncbi:MAG TPA: polysaccharide pyruvyl transferase family protein [Trichocoleus sp.]
MQLFHYRRRDGVENFGDALNLWLWPQILPEAFGAGEEALDSGLVLVGIGTLLNDRLPERLPKAQRVVVFSTGVGYEKPLRRLPAHWQIYCVRGPLSAQSLRLPMSSAITDGALLLRRCFQPNWVRPETQIKKSSFAFMPHIHHAVYGGEMWQQICQDLGFGYIDPRWSVTQVLNAISQSEVLLAEAMHGAIAADALRVPWIPVQTSPRILPFKWRDWCASVQVPFRPALLPPLVPPYPPYAQGARSGLRASRYWLRCYTQAPALPPDTRANHARAAQRLLAISRTSPMLSQDRHLAVLEERLEGAIARLKQDIWQDTF